MRRRPTRLGSGAWRGARPGDRAAGARYPSATLSPRDPLLAPSAPWILRVYAWAGPGGGATAAVGLGLALAWFGWFGVATALWGVAPGRFAHARWSSWPMAGVWALLIGMAPTVMAFTLRGTVRDVRDLAPALAASPEELGELERRVAAPPRTLLRVMGACAVVGTVAVMVPDPRYWEGGVRPPPTDPAFVWLIGRNALNWWLIVRAMAIELAVARAFSGLGPRLRDVDPLDRARLAAFGRHGLRSVLLWMLLLSLFAPVYVLGGAAPALRWSLGAVVVVAGVAFLVPVWGARARLREAKDAELARVRERVREHRARLFAGPGPETRDGRLADLLAWEARVAGASEWPFGRTTVLRFVLYTAIGLGSWVGAATVERLLGWLLG